MDPDDPDDPSGATGCTTHGINPKTCVILLSIIYVYKQDPKYPISNIAYMSVTIQSRPDNTAAGDQMVAASGQPQSRVRHEEERQSQEHLLLASRDQDQ